MHLLKAMLISSCTWESNLHKYSTSQLRFSKDFCLAVRLDGSASTVEVARFHGYCDGNFRLGHLAEAGTATVHEAPLHHRILKDTDVEEFHQSTQQESSPAEANSCNDFDADKELNRSKRKFDITGT